MVGDSARREKQVRRLGFHELCRQPCGAAQEAMSRDETLFPVNRVAVHDPVFLALHQYMHIFSDQMEQTRSKSVTPLVHDIFWREFSLARERSLRGVLSPGRALAEAEKTIQFSLNRALDYDNYVNAKMKTEAFFD